MCCCSLIIFSVSHRLVTDSRRNTTEQGTDFGTSLCETENIINEQQHILSVNITEVFCLSQTSKSNAHSHSGGFVHLSENKGALRLSSFVDLNNTGVHHFVVEIISFSSSFTNTSED